MQFTLGMVVLPDRSQCPVCGYWDVSDPETAAVLLLAGRSIREAACRCDS